MVYQLDFQATNDRLPPQNIEAEESILGGILLDPEAISRVADVLNPDAFYINAHQEIYRAALALHTQGSPTDLMCVTAWLQDQGLLDKIGGQGKLTELIDRTVSAVNIDQYAALIKDKYLRRQLIKAASHVTEFANDTTKSLETVLDECEQEIFSVTQDNVKQGLVGTEDILASTFAELEQRSLGQVLPGLSCNFYDLDAMTQGFQRSDLVIVAGRPSMGKCLAADSEILLADGRIATIEEIYRQRQADLLTLNKNWRFEVTQPSNFVDDGLKPVFRVTTKLGRTITSTLTHPFLTLQGWQPLSELSPDHKIAVPRKLEIFGQQTLQDCEVKLLAYLMGDGCLTDSTLEFTNSNPRIRADFLQAIQALGAFKVRLETSENRPPTVHIAADPTVVITQRQDFGHQLQAVLQERKLSKTKLAQALQVEPSLVTQWTQGNCVPNPKTFQNLCQILDVKPKALAANGLAAISKSGKNQLTNWLKPLGLWGKNAHTKTVPEVIFQLQRSQIALFLNRLFATDGWATVLASGQCQMGYASVSERLARQVQHLLLRFGVIATLKQRSVKYKEGHRAAWQLDITDAHSINTFMDEIGIFGKEDAVVQMQQTLSQKRYQTNRDLIPIEVWQQLEVANGEEPWSLLAKQAGIKGYSNIHVGQRALSRSRLSQLATTLADQPLQELASSEVYWDQIVSIEPLGNQQVYDLTIPETHNFVANDICVHNTALTLQIARQIAEIHKLGVAVFSLEMSKEQLVQRMLSCEAGIDSNYLRAGRIQQQQWEPLSRAIGTLSQLQIYIDDSPNPSVTELRSNARRLQAERPEGLGLILIDYLQLMGSGDSEGRVQEISKITRALKGLARELNVPVIVLSQLSRGVESRTNKRPLMSDLRECVTGDTLVWLADGRRLPIADLVGQTPEVISLDAQGQLIKAATDLIWQVGTKPIYEVRTASGRKIRATAKHRLFTFDGWKQLQDLQVGQRLAVANHLPQMASSAKPWPNSRVILLAHLIGDGSYLTHQPLRYTTSSEENSAVVKAAAEDFGCTVNRHSGKGNWHQLVISGNGNRWHPAGVGRWLKELGIFNQRSAEKHIPADVFRLPDEQIALLLRHLWATDGCISNYHHPDGRKYKASIFFSTLSEQLARDVMALLLRLRIGSQMRWSKSQCYEVHIYGKTQQLEFLHAVGAFGPRVEPAAVAKAELLRRGKANPNRDTIPIQVFDVIKQGMKERGISQRRMAALRGTSYGGTSHFRFSPTREVVESYAAILESDKLWAIANSHIYWDEIVAIEPAGEEPVYDLTVPGPASWMADGIVSHNSGSIEQDADLIILLYRDDYYNPDSPERGVCELNIAKHRNGPVGTVKLLFEPKLTRFFNMAKSDH